MSDGTTAGKVSGNQLAQELRDKAERERQARAAEDKGTTGQGASASVLLVAACTASCRGCTGIMAAIVRRLQMVCLVLPSRSVRLHTLPEACTVAKDRGVRGRALVSPASGLHSAVLATVIQTLLPPSCGCTVTLMTCLAVCLSSATFS